ncbi:MAG TPA: hypothetical protein VKT72_04155 [Candidatus Baltobacteraceae bacterium]|nr:hypothetical protein [Candidatus Baltobacteraceae bacterium]
MKLRIAVVFAAASLAIAAFGHAPARAQSLMGGNLPIDGIRCDTTEGAVEHIHTHLQIFNRGRGVEVPAQVGIMPIAGCLYWVHTHSNDGVIHIEAPAVRTFTLGQFFDIWGQSLNRSQAGSVRARRGRALRFTVNGRAWSGDPRSIPLRDREEIVIQNGPPYGTPRAADWSKL